MTIEETERYAVEQLEALRREYDKQAAPWVKILTDIAAMRPAQRMLIAATDLDAAIFSLLNETTPRE